MRMLSLSAAAIAGLFVAGAALPAASQETQCAKPMEKTYDAFSAAGDVLGEVIANSKDADGEPTLWVLKSEGGFFNTFGRRIALPGDAVDIKAGRALVHIRTKDALKAFPDYSCN